VTTTAFISLAWDVSDRHNLTVSRACRAIVDAGVTDRHSWGQAIWLVDTHLGKPPIATTEASPTGVEAEVCADIAARQRLGIAKYGRTLAESEDDMMQHAYEEALDLAAYLKAEIIRRRGK